MTKTTYTCVMKLVYF